jgi:hypothetical protein
MVLFGMVRPPHDHTIAAELAHEMCPRCRWDDLAWSIGLLAFLAMFGLTVWALS